MLPRVLETEAMDTPAEASGYDSMDHSEVNQVFVADLLAAGPAQGEMLDLGTGTALIPIELCRQDPTAWVLAVDVAENMLKLARRNVEQAGFSDRIRLQRVDAKGLPFDDGTFATVISNSIVHHVPEPSDVLREAWRVAALGALLFVRDLMRPEDDQTVQRLVDTYAADATDHQRQMFADSLRAALTVEEMRRLVGEFGQSPENVRATTDRHWTWVGRKA